MDAAYPVVIEAPELRFTGTDVAGTILQLFESRDESPSIRSEQIADTMRQNDTVADRAVRQIFE